MQIGRARPIWDVILKLNPKVPMFQREMALDTAFLYDEHDAYVAYADQPHLTEILPGLFIGDIFAAYDKTLLEAHQIEAILNVTPEIPNNFPKDFLYKHMPIVDNPATDIGSYFDVATAWLHQQWHEHKCRTLIHCTYGLSRSVTLMAAYFIRYRGKTATEALGLVKAKRKRACPPDTYLAALEHYAKTEATKNLLLPKQP